MEYTEIIALIGCVTGCCSLMINFLIYFKRRMKLKVEFPNDYPSFFFDKLYNHWHVNTDRQAIVGIRFINNSSESITIYKIDAYINEEHYYFEEYGVHTITDNVEDMDDTSILLPLKKRNGKMLSAESFDMTKQITLPIKIDSYGVEEGYMFYNFFPGINKSVNMKFIIKTSRGTKKTSFWIHEHTCNDK